MAQLLITDGAGFIGSHTAVVLLKAGHDLLNFYDFNRSRERVCELAGSAAATQLRQMEGDIHNPRDP